MSGTHSAPNDAMTSDAPNDAMTSERRAERTAETQAPGSRPTVQRDVGLVLLRVGAAALIWSFHVVPKLAHFEEELSSFPDPMGIGHAPSFFAALVSEGICSLLVAAGIGARLATLPILFTMLTVLVLAARGFEGADVQSALLYALPYASLLVIGPGRLAFDHRLRARYHRISPGIARFLVADD